jgi:hypothetical protein
MHTSAEGASSANCCIESTRSLMHATKLGPKLGFYPDNHPLAGGAVLVVVGGSSREKGDRKILPAKFAKFRSLLLLSTILRAQTTETLHAW